ncbi:MAG TPA: FAD binding domain-containing protein [Paracoccaceae bacterium]|nr:FAD binding domain-containing protein [Paracoccaceae bacterium]
MTLYLRPRSVAEAVAAMADHRPRVLAGGTDLYPAVQGADLPGPLLDLSGGEGLSGIAAEADGLRIGAMVTWAALAGAGLPPALRALQQAAVQVGGRQIQAAGTLGGNLCNASPAADGVPPLMACDAQVELAGPGGVRRMALGDFLTGPRRTALAPGELLTAVVIPAGGLAGRSAFLKLGARAYLVISIAMVAVRVVVDGGHIARACVAVGACSATARRLPVVEAALAGVPVGQAADCVSDIAVSGGLAPLDDLRASAGYRGTAAAELIRRALAEAVA